MPESDAWPSAAEVEARWIALIRGEITREEIHAWTVPWVEGHAGWHKGLRHMENGLQTLHGYSMAYDPRTPHLIHHGQPGVYVKSDQDCAAGLERWKRQG